MQDLQLSKCNYRKGKLGLAIESRFTRCKLKALECIISVLL